MAKLKWTYEACKKEALKYNSKRDLRKHNNGCYKACYRNGWLEELCLHMEELLKPIRYWTKFMCQEEAKKYKTRTELHKNNPYVFSKASKKGWLDEICSHMEVLQLPKSYWTKEKCHVEALKYKNRKAFRTNKSNIVRIAVEFGWYEDICSHMPKNNNKPRGYWNKERCAKEALKYKNTTEFVENCKSAYAIAWKNNWLEEITNHFEVRGSTHKRFIYAYEFPDNHVYVGLTYNIKERELSHNKKGSVFEHAKATGIEPVFVQITQEPVPVEKAIELEEYYLNEYISKGWTKLNKVKTGSIGGNTLMWDYESCKKEALNYNYKSDFKKAKAGAFSAAWRLGFLEEICSHMKIKGKKDV